MASVAAGARSWILPGLEVLARGFFDRPVLAVARELLGCVLVHETADGVVAVRLTEVEAYAGAADPASHAFRGRTARNAVMFGDPGHAYVYFTYGMHYCVNLVCQPPGDASAVLLRAGRVIDGASLAAVRRSGPHRAGAARNGLGGAGAARGRPEPEREPSGGRTAGRPREDDLARGPARLCQALGIDRRLGGADVCDAASPLRILGPAGVVTPGNGGAGQRLGADGGAAGPEARTAGPGGRVPGRIDRGPRVGVSSGADVEWRFWIAGDATVSAYRPHVPRRRAAGRRGPVPDGPTAGPV